MKNVGVTCRLLRRDACLPLKVQTASRLRLRVYDSAISGSRLNTKVKPKCGDSLPPALLKKLYFKIPWLSTPAPHILWLLTLRLLCKDPIQSRSQPSYSSLDPDCSSLWTKAPGNTENEAQQVYLLNYLSHSTLHSFSSQSNPAKTPKKTVFLCSNGSSQNSR